ncbi:DUF305 domain-containing protein [Micromonospora purpureochromogenes]|uniref:DUF305 domain-containing protein n=1 Tax=Micromonospora purpureochromogenes TaxID=47872 RepID=UPI003333BF86
MNRSLMRRTLLGSAAMVALLGAAACGDGESTATTPQDSPGTSASASAASAQFNDADVMFAQMMIPHHEQAVEMAELAATRVKNPELKELAAGIKAAQAPEITTMTGWLTAWGKPTEVPGGHQEHGADVMPGMVSDKDMAALKAASGSEFDSMFARLMIAHHNGAIQMARTAQSDGSNQDVKKLAVTIEQTQDAEVQTLQKFLG